MPSLRKTTLASFALLSLTTLQNASGYSPSSLVPSVVTTTTSSGRSRSSSSSTRSSRLSVDVEHRVNTNSFTSPHKINLGNSRTAIASTSQDLTEDVYQSYSEESRRYRRTVFAHEDWVRHRSSNRFFRRLITFSDSGIYKSLFKEVITTTSVAAFIVVWNMLFGEYQDFQSVTHNGPFHDSVIPILALPLAPFTLASPALGLLLVFRTNTSYKRWDEARKNWGMNINHTRDLVRLGTAYYDRAAVSPERAEEDLRRLALNTWAFVRCMKRHLSPVWEDEDDFQKELKEKLPLEQAEKIIAAAHRPNRALQDLSTSIENLPMHFMRRDEIHAAATIFEDNLGSSERLLTSPIPVFYSRHTARFLSFWLLLLPFGLWGPLGDSWNHVNLIPAMSLLSIFLFGIEELATQLEEPFTILPMQGFCDKIYNWCMEIVSFKPGDNGMPVYYYDNYNIDALNGSVGGGSLTVEAAAESVVETEEELQDDNSMAIVTDEVEVAEPDVEITIAEPETSSMVNGDAEKVDEPEKKKKRSAVRRVFGNLFGQ